MKRYTQKTTWTSGDSALSYADIFGAPDYQSMTVGSVERLKDIYGYDIAKKADTIEVGQTIHWIEPFNGTVSITRLDD